VPIQLTCREGIRLAVLQSRGEESAQLKKIVNLSIIPFFTVCLISVCVLYWYAVSRTHVDFPVIVMYCLGALLETLAEPFYNLFYCRLIMLPRLRAEMAAVACRSVVTFALVVLAGQGIRGFGAAQVAYGGVYLVVMATHVSLVTVNGKPLSLNSVLSTAKLSGILSLFRPEGGGGMDHLLVLAAHTTGSSLLKHVLTEGDKIILSISASHFNQGIYAITSNYGSLVARIIFQPVEESCRVAFSRMCSAGGDVLSKRVATFSLTASSSDTDEPCLNNSTGSLLTPQKTGSSGSGMATRTRSKADTASAGLSSAASASASEETIGAMTDNLTDVLRVMILFSLVFPVIGTHYSRAAVKLFLGAKWYSDETVGTLSCFCFYIFVISVNGISESFVHAVISPRSLYAFNISLIASWALFMGSSVPLMARYGTPGLVIANTLGMVLRSAFNLYFVQSFAKYAVKVDGSSTEKWEKFNLFQLICPRFEVLVACVFISFVCWSSAAYFAQSALRPFDFAAHFGVGAVCGLLYLLLLWLLCPDLLRIFRSVFRPRQGKEHTN
jgi:oligosaccharide translocation protein RFT1